MIWLSQIAVWVLFWVLCWSLEWSLSALWELSESSLTADWLLSDCWLNADLLLEDLSLKDEERALWNGQTDTNSDSLLGLLSEPKKIPYLLPMHWVKICGLLNIRKGSYLGLSLRGHTDTHTHTSSTSNLGYAFCTFYGTEYLKENSYLWSWLLLFSRCSTDPHRPGLKTTDVDLMNFRRKHVKKGRVEDSLFTCTKNEHEFQSHYCFF